MPKMTKQDAAMWKILKKKYGYPNASSPDQAMKQNAAKLARKAKKK